MLPVEGAADATATAIEDMGVDHGGGHVAVTEQLLDGSDVVAALQKVGRERMAQGVAARGLGDAGLADGDFDEPLQDGLVQVMAPPLPRLEVARAPGSSTCPHPCRRSFWCCRCVALRWAPSALRREEGSMVIRSFRPFPSR